MEVSGNTINADGIRMGTAAFLSGYAAPDFPFTDTVSVVLHRGLSADSVPDPSSGISGIPLLCHIQAGQIEHLFQ